MLRRSFLKGLGVLGVTTGARPLAALERMGPAPVAATGAEDRAYWVATMSKIVNPVLTNLARGQLRARMPVEHRGNANRADVTHLEAYGRAMAGLAPWLELGGDATPEGRERQRLIGLARAGLAHGVDPKSPDFFNFNRGGQPLVDAAFLAHAIVRAPKTMLDGIDATTRKNLVDALVSSRVIVPSYSNWLLFTAMVETGLRVIGEKWDPVRVDLPLRKLSEWYVGDGTYGDGSEFHWDYYNSFVMQPFLLDILGVMKEGNRRYEQMYTRQVEISKRYAAVQERLIAPDASYPLIGRSLAYRFGAFQLFAQMALRHELPEPVTPGQARTALTAVVRRVMEAPGNFDANGWLRIGVHGSQPGIGESYISTGSLYLCTVGLLPLGLPATDAFWTDPAARWTSQRAWSGEDIELDHAL
jgi:hypothetical protein